MADCTQIEKKLSEAKAAYHKMSIGRQAVQITVDGVTTTYANNRESRTNLKMYIAELQSELRVCQSGGDPSKPLARHAFKPAFGG